MNGYIKLILDIVLNRLSIISFDLKKNTNLEEILNIQKIVEFTLYRER